MTKTKCGGLLEYVNMSAKVTQPYGSYHQWLKKNGKCFTLKRGHKYSKRIKDKLESVEAHPSGCYGNSIRATIHDYDKELQYYEGYYISEGVPIPLEHAWTVDRNTGKVVDATIIGVWDKKKEHKNYGEVNYFGVPIPNEYVMAQSLKDSCYTARLGQYWKEKVHQ